MELILSAKQNMSSDLIASEWNFFREIYSSFCALSCIHILETSAKVVELMITENYLR